MLSRTAFMVLCVIVLMVAMLSAFLIRKSFGSSLSCKLAIPKNLSSNIYAWGCQGSIINVSLPCKYFVIYDNFSLSCLPKNKLNFLSKTKIRDLDSYVFFSQGLLQVYFSTKGPGFLVTPEARLVAKCTVDKLVNQKLLVIECWNASSNLSLRLAVPMAAR
jgi:hypothetical protein